MSGLSDEALSGFPINHENAIIQVACSIIVTLHEHTNLICSVQTAQLCSMANRT